MHVGPGELRAVDGRRRRHVGAAPAAPLRVVGRVRRVLVAVAAAAHVRRLVDARAREDGGDLGRLLGAQHRRGRRGRRPRRMLLLVLLLPVVVPRVSEAVAVAATAAAAVDPVQVGGGRAVVDDLQNDSLDAPPAVEPFRLDWFRSSR